MMSTELFGRLFIAAAISGLAIAAYLLFNFYILRHASSKVSKFPFYQAGLPAIVYFTTSTCQPCKTIQRPIIEQLKTSYGKWFQVIEIDVTQQPEIAREWGVMSVPTTFVIDVTGKPRYVNHGIATAEKLLQQLEIEDYSI
jgi:thioredoxin 1